jgi:putative tricarboxylic transport membrane protein
MGFECIALRSIWVAGGVAAFCAQIATEAWCQPAWRPERAVEFITSSDAGGSNDQVARAMQKVLQDARLIGVPVNVINKPGGNQTLAVIYLNQSAPDPHHLLLGNPTVFTNQLTGISQMHYLELTPVSLLTLESTTVSVRADSPIKTMRDLIDRFKADPTSLAVGIVARGGTNHLTFSMALRSAGVDPKKVRAAVFKTNAESMTALIGGHLQVVASSVTTALPQARAGNVRLLAVASPKRLGGALASVPTFKESGFDTWASNWRGVFGPKGMAAAPVQYWEEVFAKMAATEGWQKDLEMRDSEGQFMRSREFAKYLEAEYNATKSIMTELGLAK